MTRLALAPPLILMKQYGADEKLIRPANQFQLTTCCVCAESLGFGGWVGGVTIVVPVPCLCAVIGVWWVGRRGYNISSS